MAIPVGSRGSFRIEIVRDGVGEWAMWKGGMAQQYAVMMVQDASENPDRYSDLPADATEMRVVNQRTHEEVISVAIERDNVVEIDDEEGFDEGEEEGTDESETEDEDTESEDEDEESDDEDEGEDVGPDGPKRKRTDSSKENVTEIISEFPTLVSDPEAYEERLAAMVTRKKTAGSLCLCGCGGETSNSALYVVGHDARLKGILLRVERGELGEDALPTESLAMLTACKICGTPMLPHPSGIGPICRKKLAVADAQAVA